MPNAPNLTGLPVWLQVSITLLFGVVTFLVALRGYFPRTRGPAPLNQAQHLIDMAAINRLADVSHTLTGEIVSLERAIGELLHHLRANNDLNRELCQRLRELRERLG